MASSRQAFSPNVQNFDMAKNDLELATERPKWVTLGLSSPKLVKEKPK